MLHHNHDITVFTTETATVADPAVSTEWAYTVPARTRIELLSIFQTLTTDANVADRTLRILVNDGTTGFTRFSNPVSIVANLTRYLSFYVGHSGANNDAAGEGMSAAIPAKLYLYPGSTITSSLRGKQAGDQHSTIYLRLNKWITVQ